jgi:hypothetical protein
LVVVDGGVYKKKGKSERCVIFNFKVSVSNFPPFGLSVWEVQK